MVRATRHSASAVVLLAATSVFGQVYPTQSGRALDASYQLGSGGYNSIRQASRALDGNLLVTGQVTGGFQFHGTVGYAGPEQFRTTVPSAGLDDFIRGSAGLDRITSGSLYGPSAFFSPQSTILGAQGIASGQNAPGTSIPRITYASPQQARQLYESAATPERPLTPELGQQYQVNPPIRPLTPAEAALTGLDGVSEQAAGAVRPTASPLFGILRREDQQQFAEEMASAGGPPGPAGTRPQAPPFEPQQPAPEGPAAEALPEPGQDILIDVLRELMRMRREQAQAGQIGGAGQAPTQAEGEATPTTPPLDEQVRQAVERGRNQLILHRLAGKSRDLFNLHMTRAELALEKRKFYEAAEHYEVAVALNRNNALAHLGEALALLGAGEPLSSAVSLRDAMKRLPPLMSAGVDVNALLGAETVEERTKQLEERLAGEGELADPSRLFLTAFLRSVAGQPDKAAQHARQLLQRSSDEIHRAYAESLLQGDSGRNQPTTQPAAL